MYFFYFFPIKIRLDGIRLDDDIAVIHLDRVVPRVNLHRLPFLTFRLVLFIPRADIAPCFARCTDTVQRVQWTRPDPRYIDANAGPRQRTMGTDRCPSHRPLVTASGPPNSPEGTHSRAESRERTRPSSRWNGNRPFVNLKYRIRSLFPVQVMALRDAFAS